MRKLTLAIVLLFGAGCTDSTDISLYIPFALFATDELSASSTGICGFSPLTQAQGFYKSTGLLELDPDINPAASYVLGVQVENYLDQTIIADSNGIPIAGPQRNNFNFHYAIVKYIDPAGRLTSVSDARVEMSGTVRPGGQQNAASVVVQNAVSPQLAQIWGQSLKGSSFPSEEVILAVQIFGELSNGEHTQTGVFDFPLTVCFDCTGISPKAPPGNSNGCLNGFAPVPSGHGPCCSPQDFEEVCQPCGGSGQPCCPDLVGGTAPTCPGTSSTTKLTCGVTAVSTTVELCPYPQQAFIICGTGQ